MYKKVDPSIIGGKFTRRWGTPVLVMEDQYGGQVIVIVDDHCYLAKLKRKDGYMSTPYIFPELFEEMKKLPSLTRP